MKNYNLNISAPTDGRYSGLCEEINKIFSEHNLIKIWTKFDEVGAPPIKSTIFEASPKLLTRFSIFSKFRTGSSKTGSSMEHSRKVCKNVIYHRQFGLILRQT